MGAERKQQSLFGWQEEPADLLHVGCTGESLATVGEFHPLICDRGGGLECGDGGMQGERGCVEEQRHLGSIQLQKRWPHCCVHLFLSQTWCFQNH